MKFEKYAVSEIVQESRDVRTFKLAKSGGPAPSYQPGHFFLLRLPDANGKPVQRSYSAASVPGEAALWFCIKLKGAFTQLLWKLQAGSAIEVDGPYGVFMLIPGDAERVFIGGGVGISALRSMILHTVKNEGKRACLFHSGRFREALIYYDEMKKLADASPNFKFYPTITGDEIPDGWKGSKGRISAQMIKQTLGSLSGKSFYLCGSKEMTGELSAALISEGVPKERIKKDEWG
ncbi:Sulfhydrogenase 1 subunit gamma [uncultured archaeon]|nr:Sulfhydrogenase 1 subunit gamma [uncultured archaeon]